MSTQFIIKYSTRFKQKVGRNLFVFHFLKNENGLSLKHKHLRLSLIYVEKNPASET